MIPVQYLNNLYFFAKVVDFGSYTAAAKRRDELLSSPQGLVRVSCPTGLLQGGIADILARFLAKYPRVRIALDTTNRRVDIVDEGLDIAMRVRNPSDGSSRTTEAIKPP